MIYFRDIHGAEEIVKLNRHENVDAILGNKRRQKLSTTFDVHMSHATHERFKPTKIDFFFKCAVKSH